MQAQVQGQGDLLEEELGIHTYCSSVTIIVSALQPLERHVR